MTVESERSENDKSPRRAGIASPGLLPLLARFAAISGLSALYLLPAAAASTLAMIVRGREAACRHLSRRLVALLQRLGPTFIKGGQILSMRKDLLPLALCQQLALLHDAVTPLSETVTREAIADVYGGDFDELFAEFDFRARASGSIACVYWARLVNGREAAVKLRRPGIERTMQVDLTLALRMSRLMARIPPFRGLPMEEMLSFICDAIHAQLDFRRERDCLIRLRDNLSPLPRVWVPRVEREACRDEAVVMEYISDLDSDPMDQPTSARRQLAAGTLAAVYRMLFIDGFVHCDLHPGNLYFRRRGQIVVLDAGFSVQLSDRLRRLFAEFFMNMSLGHGRHCAEIVIESTDRISPDANLPEFTKHMADLVERNSGIPAREFSLIAFSLEMFQLQHRYGLFAATELVFPLLCLLVIEQTVRELDPDIDFQQEAQSIITEGVFGRRASHWAGHEAVASPASGETGAC